jgi:predicted DNA-binding protein with PD1-like motif
LSETRRVVMHKPFAEAAKIGEVILSRLMPEEDLFAGLSKIAGDHGIKRGVILSAIGSLKNVVFVNVRPHTVVPVKTEDMIQIEDAGPFELLSLEGNFSSQEGGEPVIHLHAILGTSSGSVSGGHLLKATVFTTAEILLGSITGSSVFKAKSDVTQRMELLLSRS